MDRCWHLAKRSIHIWWKLKALLSGSTLEEKPSDYRFHSNPYACKLHHHSKTRPPFKVQPQISLCWLKYSQNVQTWHCPSERPALQKIYEWKCRCSLSIWQWTLAWKSTLLHTPLKCNWAHNAANNALPLARDHLWDQHKRWPQGYHSEETTDPTKQTQARITYITPSLHRWCKRDWDTSPRGNDGGSSYWKIKRWHKLIHPTLEMTAWGPVGKTVEGRRWQQRTLGWR